LAKSLKILPLLLSLFFGVNIFAQATFYMSTQYTEDCEGILFDSENNSLGDFPTGYDGNENYTFTICVPGTDQISITFEFLDTEEDHDFISFYDGADRNAPLISTMSGQTGGFTIVSTGECLTIHFTSDGSKQFEGWRAEWTVNPPEPTIPVFTFVSPVSCGDQTITVQFDEPIPCSELRPDNFTFAGPAGGGVASVTPVNCVNGETTEAIITFNAPLDESGTYRIDLDYIFANCVRPFPIHLDTTFDITDCPLELELLGPDEVCQGECITLFADVKGGNPANYQFTWTPNQSTSNSMTVCPTAPLTVTVTVTDGQSQPVTDSKTITILTLPEAGDDFSICEFALDTNLSGTPAGGAWAGAGIINGGNGTFRPRSARDGIHKLYYYGPNGCRDSAFATVHNVSAGPNITACKGDPAFNLTGTPAGGTWGGDNTTGNFDPVAGGTFNITYTEPINGCIDNTVITVVDSIILPPFDSMVVCINKPQFIIPHSPGGGRWTGTGITNRNQGQFNASTAGEGTFILYYALPSGCIDSASITVTAINAGIDTIVCPSDVAFILPAAQPLGGTYSGTGVTDNGDGTFSFDPGVNGLTSSTVPITYTFGDCSDIRNIYIIQTSVDQVQLEYCEYEDSVRLVLNDYNPNPAGGTWTLTGHNNDTLDIAALTVGTIYDASYNYNNNSCIATLQVLVNPKPLAGITGMDTSICVNQPDFDLTGTPTGGTWSGTGIVDPNAGTFSATSLGFNGTFIIEYELNGCLDSMIVEIKDPVPQIGGVAEEYCINGNTYTFSGNPAGGYFKGNPGIIDPQGTFSPDAAGPGLHEVIYVYGTGACTFYDTVRTTVHPPIQASLNFEHQNPLCYGDSMPIRVIASGGNPGNELRYSWNLPDVGNTNFYVPRPTDTLRVEVTISDRCSYDVFLFDSIFVHPEITHSTWVGPPLCYGDSNFAKVFLTSDPPINQTITWYEDQSFVGDSIYTVPDRYPFSITDNVTGCVVWESVRINEYPEVIAGFLLQPSEGCLSIVDPKIYIINSSVGADRGTWIVGDTIIDYASSGNIEYTFKDTAVYEVSLSIQNEIGCADSLRTTVCVDPVWQYFLPNAFSPNGDGDNEFWPTGHFVSDTKYLPMGYNLFDYEMQIYDRWGERVYENKAGNNPPWDGTIKGTGTKAMPGVYVYKMKLWYSIIDVFEITGKVVLLH
jgi:gliding motility-associated-like protein